jgi:hypothetical protein
MALQKKVSQVKDHKGLESQGLGEHTRRQVKGADDVQEKVEE